MKLAIVFFACVASVAVAQQKPGNYDEAKVGEITLPDVLLGMRGEKVASAGQWTDLRRPEVLGLFQDHVYGRIQPRPEDLQFAVTATKVDALGGKATRKFIHISLAAHPQWQGLDVMLYVPNGIKGRVPAFAGLSFGGNHTVTIETDVPIDDRRERAIAKNSKAPKSNKPAEALRGSEARRWQLEMIINQGFALATACYVDIEPDHVDGWKDGVRAALSPDGVNTVWRDGDWGAIGAWSWGLSRILDYLQTDKDVDGAKVAVIGHSRLGKTALWAGASDPRFAIVISNNSGEGGAALMRRNIGETTAIITRTFPHWFTPKYRSYADRAHDCPVDQHMLIALVAPRPVYIASAADDSWADPLGEFLAGKSAEPVYALFGKGGLGVDHQPAVDHPVGDFIAYHIRTGKHEMTAYDWSQYLKFAAKHFGYVPAG